MDNSNKKSLLQVSLDSRVRDKVTWRKAAGPARDMFDECQVHDFFPLPCGAKMAGWLSFFTANVEWDKARSAANMVCIVGDHGMSGRPNKVFRTMRSGDHDVVLVRRTIDLRCWEFGMGREWEGGGQFTSNLRPRWTVFATVTAGAGPGR